TDCPDGQTCEGGACVPTGCTDASECGACDTGDPVCMNGMCMCGTPCDGNCPDGQFCCNSEDMCRPIPDECGTMTCEPGFMAQVSSPGSGDPTTCEVTNPVCECVELPPLPMGRYGLYTNIDANTGVVAVSAYNGTYGDLMLGMVASDGRSEERRVGKECRSRGSPDH